jgi:orotate phosphoribosyltransferase
MVHTKQEFIRFALETGALKFGQFQTKAGRISPYFFNTGEFSDGNGLNRLAQFYAQALLDFEAKQSFQVDLLFGPAYKGITLASATAVALAQRGRNLPFTFNRKEAKDHGEGGLLIGAPLKGKIVIVDDVISAGTSVRQSVEIIRAAGAQPAAVLITVDRMERGGTASAPTDRSAVQEVEQSLGIPVVTVINLDDLMNFLENDPVAVVELSTYRAKVAEYRARYGVKSA